MVDGSNVQLGLLCRAKTLPKWVAGVASKNVPLSTFSDTLLTYCVFTTSERSNYFHNYWAGRIRELSCASILIRVFVIIRVLVVHSTPDSPTKKKNPSKVRVGPWRRGW
jgi:hypothetical protein